MDFDHVGLITTEKKEKENWVEATRVWVTNPKEHPFHIEWLRYEPDSSVKGPVREMPHVAYSVEDIETASQGLRVLLEPFDVGNFVRVGFYQNKDGAVIEFMQYKQDKDKWFGGKGGNGERE